LDSFVRARKLGKIVGKQATMQILTGLVRIPDVAFISWDRFPNRRIPEEPVPALVPDLAIEVISKNNTLAEMARKRHEYFTAGVRLVWMVDHFSRTVTVYTSEKEFRTLTESDILDGGGVLPGLAIPIRDIFAELDAHG
jgi:Uma2 family endonuclease